MGAIKGRMKIGQRHKVLRAYAKRESKRDKQNYGFTVFDPSERNPRASLRIVKKRYALIAAEALRRCGIADAEKKAKIYGVLTEGPGSNAAEYFAKNVAGGGPFSIPIASRLDRILGRRGAQKFEFEFMKSWRNFVEQDLFVDLWKDTNDKRVAKGVADVHKALFRDETLFEDLQRMRLEGFRRKQGKPEHN